MFVEVTGEKLLGGGGGVFMRPPPLLRPLPILNRVDLARVFFYLIFLIDVLVQLNK